MTPPLDKRTDWPPLHVPIFLKDPVKPLYPHLCRHLKQCETTGCTADCIADNAMGPSGSFAVPELKDTNPKDGIGATKLPLHLVPASAIALASLAHLDGALKYGAWNWRIAGVRASIYMAAAKRHLDKWFNGEELDGNPDDEDSPGSGLPHLAHALACLNILVDATVSGKLNDDRPPRQDVGGYFDDLTPHVARLTAKHADKHPVHYTIDAGVRNGRL